jgi:RNA polymerase primary sigma factor
LLAADGAQNSPDLSFRDPYFGAIINTPLLSPREELELARRVRDGDVQARDQMVRANLRLVVKIAHRYAGLGLDLSDLIAEGNVGLLRAVQDFDPARKTRFSTCACFWIKQAIRHALKYTSRTIRLPAHLVDLLAKWRRATSRVQDRLGRPPTTEEVARSLGLSRKKLAVVTHAIRAYSKPGPQRPPQPRAMDELIIDSRSPIAERALIDAEDKQFLRGLLDVLDEREAILVRMRFGFEQEHPSTFKEIGERLGLTPERVRQGLAQPRSPDPNTRTQDGSRFRAVKCTLTCNWENPMVRWLLTPMRLVWVWLPDRRRVLRQQPICLGD